jgi:uncharacterized protein
MVTFDANKSRSTFVRRGLSFEMVERFEWSTAIITVDDRHDYGEIRLRATGLIDGELYMVVFTPRTDIHVISLRRANKKERRLWHASRTPI